MIELVIEDMQQRLEFHDWVALAAVLSMLATPYLIVGWQMLVTASKNKINKHLAQHGLRLKERA